MSIRRLGFVCAIAASLVLAATTARGASAVAASVDNIGYCYQLLDADAAAQCALRSCDRRSRQPCHVVATCARGGYGAIFLRLLPGHTIEAIGVACGRGSRADSFREAARRCNETSPSSACRGPHGAWFDRNR